ncbi:MAG: hypothetical protein SWE60_13895 [Thermodesulfobacteriota bacterium]|nr:hypothetical protein [Thermodesulfobacteriota bacterium]
MSFRNIALLFVSVGMLVSSAGCASFREGNVPRARSASQSAVAEGKTISVEVYGAAILNGKIYQAHPKTMKTWRRQTIKAYEDAGIFSVVREDADGAELEAEVMIVDKADPNTFFAFITGLTLYVLPSKATDEFTVQTTIRDRGGNTLGTFERSETVSLWQQVLLILAMPFNWPSSVAKEALYDLNHATIMDAYSQGIL